MYFIYIFNLLNINSPLSYIFYGNYAANSSHLVNTMENSYKTFKTRPNSCAWTFVFFLQLSKKC